MAAVFGGIVYYRGSTTTGKPAVGAALTAVGAVMLLALGGPRPGVVFDFPTSGGAAL